MSEQINNNSRYEAVTIELIGGCEGDCIAINNRRVAGNKPWGGGKIKASVKTNAEKILLALGYELKSVRKVKKGANK